MLVLWQQCLSGTCLQSKNYYVIADKEDDRTIGYQFTTMFNDSDISKQMVSAASK